MSHTRFVPLQREFITVPNCVTRGTAPPNKPKCLNVRLWLRLCKNDFLETETKYRIKKLAFAATMIRRRYLPGSIVAQLVSVSAFLHRLDPLQRFYYSDG